MTTAQLFVIIVHIWFLMFTIAEVSKNLMIVSEMLLGIEIKLSQIQLSIQSRNRYETKDR